MPHQAKKGEIVHVFRQNGCPDFSGINYSWDVIFETGRTTMVYRLNEIREDCPGGLHRGLHPDPQTRKRVPFDTVPVGWSVYWGEYQK